MEFTNIRSLIMLTVLAFFPASVLKECWIPEPVIIV